jgi:hypothetical protein
MYRDRTQNSEMTHDLALQSCTLSQPGKLKVEGEGEATISYIDMYSVVGDQPSRKSALWSERESFTFEVCVKFIVMLVV